MGIKEDMNSVGSMGPRMQPCMFRVSGLCALWQGNGVEAVLGVAPWRSVWEGSNGMTWWSMVRGGGDSGRAAFLTDI
jgi:hypothetical protein